MKLLLVRFGFGIATMLGLLPACGKDGDDVSSPGPPTATMTDAPADPLPGPARAAAAAERVRADLTAALGAIGLRLGDPVFLRAFKEERELELFVRDRKSGKFMHFRTYPIAAASGTPGPKMAEGDNQVPEGFYSVGPGAMKPDSQFHLAFNIGFPNEYDRAHGRTGSAIMVHGNQVSIGCLAMTDAKIEEIYTLCAAALNQGQAFFRVHLFPFRMTPERMTRAAGDPWIGFWINLKEGYDRFEQTGVPPAVSVKNGRYRFSNSSGRRAQ